MDPSTVDRFYRLTTTEYVQHDYAPITKNMFIKKAVIFGCTAIVNIEALCFFQSRFKNMTKSQRRFS